ncbi:MAG: hypothetical protein VB064_14605 [Oscillospiraceae bacterium]|nr:hypothetical protein [Oscillospiraceae bacterium]
MSSYAKAVLWSVEKGIINGTSANAFELDMNVMCGQIMTFLYRHFVKQ